MQWGKLRDGRLGERESEEGKWPLLYASDLLTHHFSFYTGLEAKSEGQTHDQLCAYASLCTCVYIAMTVWDINVTSGLQSVN